jgi:A/G-specific adenine glycosylase
MSITPETARSLRRELVRWFARARRDLPWRRTSDPYAVWISEAMLQQTRVEVVIPYYLRFMKRFPDVAVLANAPEEEVLAAWSGLGYYRRAKSLQAAARAVVERHSGSFPSERDALLALPGIGPYTAGAIASIAFDRQEPLVDGNVARVLARLFACDAAPDSAAERAELWALARELVPGKGAGDWNQALMELGALVCTPREPACERCPLSARCEAFRHGCVAELPRKKARPAAVPVELVVLAASDGERWLLERRPPTGRMAGMWQLPTVELAANGGLLFPTRKPRALREGDILCTIRHTITCHRIRATVKRAVLTAAVPAPPLAWVSRAALGEMPLTGMTRKCLTAILAPPGKRSPARPPAPSNRSSPSPPKRPRA